MDDKDYEELLRKMLGQDMYSPDYSASTPLQAGLLGDTPGNNIPQQAGSSNQDDLAAIHQNNQASTQGMKDITQQGIQAGMQAAQELQAQRNAQMGQTEQQAKQALMQQQQQEAQIGQLFGNLLKLYL